jgi:hypothetical protein
MFNRKACLALILAYIKEGGNSRNHSSSYNVGCLAQEHFSTTFDEFNSDEVEVIPVCCDIMAHIFSTLHDLSSIRFQLPITSTEHNFWHCEPWAFIGLYVKNNTVC